MFIIHNDLTLSILIDSQQGRKKSGLGTDLGTGYGGTVSGFHTRPLPTDSNPCCPVLSIYLSIFAS